VQFGVFLTPDASQPERLLTLAVLADELGFDLIGIQDHPYQRRFFDAWTLITAIAMRTRRITVFPDVINLPLRPPAVLAKAAASLDPAVRRPRRARHGRGWQLRLDQGDRRAGPDAR
jgi:alkanesulfonate monooxygenase SsuD/methylene tetrahydromethanopterin reductase-like flavin-dependent oxidoreductase (luciferase family)